jgi:hypothetical protein
MRWEDEQFVKVYVRDTVDWLALSYDARSLFLHLLRKVDRAGILPLGRHGRRGVAVLLGALDAWSRLELALAELEQDGCLRVEGDRLVIPNFTAAQEARQTDRARKQAQRERDRAQAMDPGSVTGKDAMASVDRSASQHVTPSVTSGHTTSREVTLRRDEIRLDETREETPQPPRGGQQELLDVSDEPQDDASDAEDASPAPEALQALWNRVAVPLGRPRWRELGSRRRAVKGALATCPDLERWEGYLRWRLQDPFYRGELTWSGADVEWFLRPKTAREVCDFDPDHPPAAPKGRPGRMDTTPSDFSKPPEGEGWVDMGEFDPAAGRTT